MTLFPELELVVDQQERRRILSAASSHIHMRPIFWIALIAGSIVISVVLSLALVGLGRYVRISAGVRAGIVATIISASIGLLAQYAFRKPMQKYIRQRLVEMGIPICIACGYDLRGQQEPRCPECGTPAEPGPQPPTASPNG
jgi:hypothetical protein